MAIGKGDLKQLETPLSDAHPFLHTWSHLHSSIVKGFCWRWSNLELSKSWLFFTVALDNMEYESMNDSSFLGITVPQLTWSLDIGKISGRACALHEEGPSQSSGGKWCERLWPDATLASSWQHWPRWTSAQIQHKAAACASHAYLFQDDAHSLYMWGFPGSKISWVFAGPPLLRSTHSGT